MNSVHLNEHDANQGAQSSGEFLGMTGNSGWYLLGSGGATIMMVILLWGILGISLLLCLFIGIILCLGSLAYVFALKNNKPEHYDTDFLESVLVESGLLEFRFGPRRRRVEDPFTGFSNLVPNTSAVSNSRRFQKADQPRTTRGRAHRVAPASAVGTDPKPVDAKAEKTVTRDAYDQLQEKLTSTEELLEEALVETVEN